MLRGHLTSYQVGVFHVTLSHIILHWYLFFLVVRTLCVLVVITLISNTPRVPCVLGAVPATIPGVSDWILTSILSGKN